MKNFKHIYLINILLEIVEEEQLHHFESNYVFTGNNNKIENENIFDTFNYFQQTFYKINKTHLTKYKNLFFISQVDVHNALNSIPELKNCWLRQKEVMLYGITARI